jgi:hypothetical protein
MNIENDTKITEGSYREHIQSLKKVCEWADVSMGRVVSYINLIREYFVDGKESSKHILAYNESREIIDIFEFWEPYVSLFPGIKEKIKRCFKKGVILREDENPSESTNRPRNDAFVLLLAGILMKANIKVMAVEGIVARGTKCHEDADITLEWDGSVIDMQCKRPQTEDSLEERAEEAYEQLTKSNRQGQLGIIAIDCSAFIRPLGKVVEAESAERAMQHLANLLERVKPKLISRFEPNILGYLLFARVPGMTTTRISPILSPKGTPYKDFRFDSISRILCLGNKSSPDVDMYMSIYEKIKTVY